MFILCVIVVFIYFGFCFYIIWTSWLLVICVCRVACVVELIGCFGFTGGLLGV